MILDDALDASGSPLQTILVVDADRLRLEVTGRAPVELPAAAVVRVLERYGRPLEEPPKILERIELGQDTWLGRMQFHAIVDAEARDYLVLGRADGEPIAAIAMTVAAALRFLGERAS